MNPLLQPLTLLPWLDWLVLLCIHQLGAAPEAKHFSNASQRETFADRAGRVMGLAAETFMVLVVLYRREFHSEVLLALREGLGPMQTPS